MPIFPTATPIRIDLDLGAGDVIVTASDREDVVVTVLPASPDKPRDQHAVDDVRVDFADGLLSVQRTKSWRHYTGIGPTGMVTIELQVPQGSSLRGKTGYGRMLSQGRLGDVSFTTAAGDVSLDTTADVTVSLPAGAISITRADGRADLKASAGAIRVNELVGDAVIKNSNGGTVLGRVLGDVHITGANGSVAIESTRGAVDIKGAYGDITIERAEAGTARIATGYGSVEIGVPDGVAAWLDLRSERGTVRNLLEDAPAPADGTATVALEVGTGWGGITVRRSRR